MTKRVCIARKINTKDLEEEEKEDGGRISTSDDGAFHIEEDNINI